MKLADIKKIDREKLPNESVKGLYDDLSNDTDGFNPDFIELYEAEILEFIKIIKEKVPEAITERVVKQRQPRKKAEKPIDFEDDDVVETVMEDYNLTKDKAVKLIALRKEAYELKKENIEKLLDRLDKSEFYQGKNSKAPIDKGRTRDLGKDSKQGSITLAEERKMTRTPFKRISKAGGKNQYGTTEGNKVYYEYRMNRRDVDNKIRLEKGGGVDMFVSHAPDPNNWIPSNGKNKDFKIDLTFNDKATGTPTQTSYLVSAPNEKQAKENALWNLKQDFPLAEQISIVKTELYKNGGGVGIPNADKMFHLPYEIAVYVPSTKDVDKNITATELRARVKEVEKYLAETFGGFTSAEKVGGYLSSKSSVIKEKVIPVTAFATIQSFRQHKSKLVNKMSVWAKSWGQEAIGFEFEGDLYYVPQKFKKGGKLIATYIPKSDIKMLTTVWGNNIKGKDLLDGAYTKRTDIKTQPKMARTMFEDEIYEYGTGGKTEEFKNLIQSETGKVWDREYSGYGEDLSSKMFKIYWERAEKTAVENLKKIGKLPKEYKQGGRIHTLNGRKVWRWYPEWKTSIIDLGDVFYYGNSRNDFMGFEVIDFTEADVTFKVVEGAWGSQKVGDVFKETADTVAYKLRKDYYKSSSRGFDDDRYEYKTGGKTKPTEPIIVRGFSDDEAYEYAKGGKPKMVRYYFEDEEYEYAKGGMTAHGLKRGDTIVDDMFWENKIVVKGKDGKRAMISLETGLRTEEK